MRIFIEKKQSNPCKNLGEPCSNSTLLIPEVHLVLFQKKLEEYNFNTTAYLSYLLRRYRLLVRNGYLHKHEFLKTGYQEKYQNLKRFDFTPNAKDWAELKCLRAFLNRSMTWIFVSLLLLDSLDLEKNLPKKLAEFVVPKTSPVRLMVNVTLSRKKFLYDRMLCMTRDRAG